jgi:uncharacterized protein YecE (DUF72 family)
LKKEGRLTAILAQFPYSFHAIKDNYDYLGIFKERLRDIPVVVEFRNHSWHNEMSLKFLKENNIGYCIVDEPRLKGLMPYNPTTTTDIDYFRFHGRNANWFDASTSERYDYLYTQDELKPFMSGIRNIATAARKTIVMINNCHAGKAARNALKMIEMLK